MALDETALNKIKADLMKKMADGSITIREYLQAAELHTEKLIAEATEAGKKEIPPKLGTSAIKKSMDALGIDLDSRWGDLATSDSEDLRAMLSGDHSHTSSSTFTSLQAVEKRASQFYTNNKSIIKKIVDILPEKLQFANITGKGNIAQSFGDKDVNPKAYQTRRTDRFDAIPSHKESIRALSEGINNIRAKKGASKADIVRADKVRQAVSFMCFVPFRPGEIGLGNAADGAAEFRIKIEDVDLDTGYIKGVTRGNKTRPAIVLPEGPALELLRDAIGDRKSGPVFDVKVKDMSDAINGTATWMGGTKDNPIAKSVKQLFLPYENIMGRTVKGIKDIRKIVPSLLAAQLKGNAGAVSSIMGHDSTTAILNDLKNMTAAHYVSPVAGVVEENDPIQRALIANQNMWANSLNLPTVNEVIGRLGASARRLWDPNLKNPIEGKDILGVSAEDPLAKSVPTKEATPEQKRSIAQSFKTQIALGKERAAFALKSAAEALKQKFEIELENLKLRKLIAEREPDVVVAEQEAAKKIAALKAAETETDMVGTSKALHGDVAQTPLPDNATPEDIRNRKNARRLAMRLGERLLEEGVDKKEIFSQVSEILEKSGQVLTSDMAKRLGLAALLTPVTGGGALAAEVGLEFILQATEARSLGETPVGDLEDSQLLEAMQQTQERIMYERGGSPDRYEEDTRRGSPVIIDEDAWFGGTDWGSSPVPRIAGVDQSLGQSEKDKLALLEKEASGRYADEMKGFLRRQDTAEREAVSMGLPKDRFKAPKEGFIKEYEDYFDRTGESSEEFPTSKLQGKTDPSRSLRLLSRR